MINYKQYDTRWAKLGYPRSPYFIRDCGCGEVAICNVMVKSFRWRNETPKTIQPYCKQFAAPNGDGTYFSGIPKMLDHYGFTEIKEHAQMKTLWKELKKGGRVAIYLMGSKPGGSKGVHWTSSAHFVCSTNYKHEEDHMVYVKDSNSTSPLRNGWLSYTENMKGDVLKVWSAKCPKLTNREKIAKYGWKYAYHSNTSLARYPGGRPKPAYAKALDKYFGKNRKWSTPAKKGASCDVFIATCIRAAGLGDAPRGIVRSWLNASKNFKQVKVTPETAKNGDIVSIVWKNGNPHWCMVYNGKILEASYGGWYPKVTNTLKSRLSKSGKQSVVVYRAK